MKGKTHKMRRRLSTVVLVASIAAVAIPAASAGGKYLGPGSNRVEKHGPYGVYWVPMHRVLGPGLVTVEKHGPYGAYWIPKPQSRVSQYTPTHDPASQPASVAQSQSRANQSAERILIDAAQEHGAAGFGNAISVNWKPIVVDYSHLPTQDRP